ncbi:MAG: SLC13 family permease [Phycisphaeraceae bacterium]
MSVDAWITLTVLIGLVSLLVFTRYAADLVLVGALTVLMVAPVPTDQGWKIGVITIAQGLIGLSNPGMVTVAVLFVVAAAMRETGALDFVTQRLLGRPRTLASAQFRMMLPVAGLSAFLNNTPIVAMMIPIITDWARKNRISVSKLLIPLSYATILGGTCTLIGTSTNLVVNGLMIVKDGKGLGLFDLAWVGVPCAVIGLGYLMLTGRRLLPERKAVAAELDDPRKYTVEMLVEIGSVLVDKTIEQAGLRHLPGLYLAEISRAEQRIVAVGPGEKLRESDRLVFVGIVESVVDLQKIRGLVPATTSVFKLEGSRSRRGLFEAVVSDQCPLVRRTIREGRFRTVYNAAVIAVSRSGQRIVKKIGDIVLQPGDTLLVEAGPDWLERHRNDRDFYLVSAVDGYTPPRHDRAWVALVILLAMVAFAATGIVSMLQAAMVAGGLMLLTRCLSGSAARRSVDWSVLLVIAAAFGIGQAMEVSGAAANIAHGLIGLGGHNPYVMLALVYLVTMIFTAFMTNNAAAVLLFAIAGSAAGQIGVSPMPFYITVMMAASNDFATPIGYQTNLMVWGPGGYRFSDYTRIGLPLSLILWAVTVAIVPRVWPF